MDRKETKYKILKEVRAFNENPERVRVHIFHINPFFDPADKAQVKYEMLRSRELEGRPLKKICEEFGYTRERYRAIMARFCSEGMAGLFDQKRGRRNPIKVTEEVRSCLCKEHERDPDLKPAELIKRCKKKTGIEISRRTLYRVREQEEGQKKKRYRKKKRLDSKDG